MPLLIAAGGAAFLAAACIYRGAGGAAASLKGVNMFVLFLWVTLPLTGGGGVPSPGGVRLALLLTLKVNIIAVVFFYMVAALGPGVLGASMGSFGVPSSLAALFLLTFRQIMILRERFVSSLQAASLRAPDRKLWSSPRTFAAILGSALIHGADRAERTRLAMLCRGGIAGFAAVRELRWRLKDSALLFFFLALAGLIFGI